MTARMIDRDGDQWPVTGVTCAACGWPLTPHIEGQKLHPACCPEGCNLDGTPREVKS